MELGIAGKVALVTGASEGIGKAIAAALAAEGATVVVNARGKERLDAAAAELEAAGGRVSAVAGDVSSTDDIEALVTEVRRSVGDPDVLVVNAGGPPKGLPSALSDEQWRLAYELTLMSAVRLTREVLPAMRRSGWGRIINVTSLSVREPIDELTLSNAMRSGLTAFARTLATEVAAEGVTVNNIAPGYTATARLNELFDDDAAKAALVAIIPARRLAEPAEIAAAAVFLASSRAGYITGQTLLVDGGFVRSQF
ncbi:MAG TPA: SDR family oxidoreductase [Trueperaceae bacterium]|nr:SDR family oxidoreductase [Trueperaceae bacterium]